jgi:prephenate dehydrogenase
VKVFVCGTGHMGSWFAKFLIDKGIETALSDTRPEALDPFRDQARIIDSGDAQAVQDFAPDLFLNSVNITSTEKVFDHWLPLLPEHCALADLTSVKGKLPEFYKNLSRRFLSFHPMFGPTFGNVSDLQDQNLIYISESDRELLNWLQELFRNSGLREYYYSFKEHDRTIAYSLGLPFASTLVFAACMDEKAVPGTTFEKHLDIARGLLSEDDDLLADILFHQQTLEEIELVTNKLEYLKHIIRGKHYDEASNFFDDLRSNIGLKS